MKISIISKTFFSIPIFLFLASCSNKIVTYANYNLPTVVNKNPKKKGETCARFIFPFSLLYSNYDLSVEKAQKDAGIKEIISIEQETRDIIKFSYFPSLYSHNCIIVRGN
ncbi:MAG: TRL domain-containing protein [Alphaproteobacteria bacterium]